ncbi:MAG: dihydrolipoamide acetyltransferase family protein [Rhodoglobus sp.]
MTVKDFALPDLGEGLTESEIVAWHVAEGDMVALNQVIADVETAKAMVELPSPYAGRIARLHVTEGTTVAVGNTIVSFEVDATDVAPASPEPAPEPEADPEEAPPNLVGYGAAPQAAGQPVRRARTLPTAEPSPSLTATVPQRRAAPPVRKLAESLGVDLMNVHGSGEAGLITRADVEAAAGDRSPTPTVQSPDGTTVPVAGIRKLTAEAVTRSAFTAPHVTVFLSVDVTRTVELLDELRSTAPFREVRLTFLAAVAKAVCTSMQRSPQVNSRWDEQGITRFDHVNLGIAAATPRGLLVPVVRGAHALDLAGLAAALTQLARTAKAGEIRPPDLTGGTFTITNVGVFGVDAGTPILNNGEAAILAVGAVARRPWEWRGEVALRHVVTLSLSFDHRVLDGEQGSRFLADVGRLLNNPAGAFAL